MAWPTEAGSLGIIAPPLIERRRRTRKVFARVTRGIDARLFGPLIPPPGHPAPKARRIIHPPIRRRKPARDRALIRPMVQLSLKLNRYYVDVRENYRIFNAAVYRFYKGLLEPPAEGSAPFATSPTLAFSPTDVFGNGTHYLSVSWFNGVLDSGFLPIGPNGEPYLRLEITGGVILLNPPLAPVNVRLIRFPAGVIRVQAVYFELGAGRASEWAITYTLNGSEPGTPPAVAPTVTQTIVGANLSVLEYDLPGQANGVTVKVRVQVRRNDSGTWRYSVGSTVLTAIADALGPTAAEGAGVWRGAAPQEM